MTRAQCYILGVLLGVAAAPFAVMLFDRREPVTLTFGPDDHCYEDCSGQIIPYYVHPLQEVEIKWPLIENRKCEGEYSRRIREGRTGKVHIFGRQGTAYTEATSTDRRWFSRSLVIPKAVGPGPATYWTVGYRWCNFMQKYFWPIPFRSPDIQFEVLPEGQPAPTDGKAPLPLPRTYNPD
jgi:hypothetical protein